MLSCMVVAVGKIHVCVELRSSVNNVLYSVIVRPHYSLVFFLLQPLLFVQTPLLWIAVTDFVYFTYTRLAANSIVPHALESHISRFNF